MDKLTKYLVIKSFCIFETAFITNEEIYITDTKNHMCRIFNSNGKYVNMTRTEDLDLKYLKEIE